MREFPHLEPFADLSPEVVAEQKGGPGDPWTRAYSSGAVVSIYNELRAAYLALQGEVRILLYGLTGDFKKWVGPVSPDPRLPGERRVPVEPGLYLARYETSRNWDYLIWIDGDPPYLEAYSCKIQPSCSLQACYLGRETLYFGPRLAGPEWRKVDGLPAKPKPSDSGPHSAFA